MYLQRSIIHRHELTSKIEQQTALQNERQMEVQHRLYKSTDNHNFDNGNRISRLIFFCSKFIFRFMFTGCFHAVSIWKCHQSTSLSIFSFDW